MKAVDVIFALICGRTVGFLVGDFMKAWGVELGISYFLVLWILLPFISLFCLWLAHEIGRKLLFVFQGAKFLLVGAFATIVDLKLFEGLVIISGAVFLLNPTFAKAISFLFATLIKYWGNKYWAFNKHEKENMRQEIMQFFGITLVGLAIDVASFHYFAKTMGPQFGLSTELWVKLSVIFAALAAAVWNFAGYKFFVFKK